MGVDPDGARIALARKTFGHLKSLKLVEGSSDTLTNDCGKASFDAVFSNYVLHFVKDKRRAFENIYEILKPGGRVAMLYETEIPPLSYKVVKELNPEKNYKRMREMFCFEEKESIDNYCRDAGFVITESIKFNQTIVNDNLLDWLNVVSSSSHGVFDLDLLDERKFKIFDKWIDKEGRFVHEIPVGFLLAKKPLTL